MQRNTAVNALKQAMESLEAMSHISSSAPEFILWRAEADTALCELEGEDSPLVMEFRALQFGPCTVHEHKTFAWRINKRLAMDLLFTAWLNVE